MRAYIRTRSPGRAVQRILRRSDGLPRSHNLLTDLPDSIGKLHALTTLHVANNELVELPSTIGARPIA